MASRDEANSSGELAIFSLEIFRPSGEAGDAGGDGQSASPEPLGLSPEKPDGSPEPARGSGEADQVAPEPLHPSPDETELAS